MKKFTLTFLLFALVTSYIIVPSSAVAADISAIQETQIVQSQTIDIVDYGSIVNPRNAKLLESNRAVARKTIVNLSEESCNVNWELPAEKTLYSVYRFKTNSTEMVINLAGSEKVNVTVRLYDDSNGAVVGTKSGTLSKNDKAFSFSALSASKVYYFSVTNNGQKDCTLTGVVTD